MVIVVSCILFCFTHGSRYRKIGDRGGTGEGVVIHVETKVDLAPKPGEIERLINAHVSHEKTPWWPGGLVFFFFFFFADYTAQLCGDYNKPL